MFSSLQVSLPSSASSVSCWWLGGGLTQRLLLCRPVYLARKCAICCWYIYSQSHLKCSHLEMSKTERARNIWTLQHTYSIGRIGRRCNRTINSTSISSGSVTQKKEEYGPTIITKQSGRQNKNLPVNITTAGRLINKYGQCELFIPTLRKWHWTLSWEYFLADISVLPYRDKS